ncbi:hypothetical protein ABZP36_006985 [Zizania latifolia]
MLLFFRIQMFALILQSHAKREAHGTNGWTELQIVVKNRLEVGSRNLQIEWLDIIALKQDGSSRTVLTSRPRTIQAFSGKQAELRSHQMRRRRRFPQVLCVLLSTLCVSRGCLDEERIALLDIRASLLLGTETAGRKPASWWLHGGDCCSWEGVLCDSSTRRVSRLYLSSLVSGLHAPARCRTNLNSAAFSAFRGLQLLDFSMNYVTFQSWDGLVGLTKLRYLKLSNNCLNGSIPASLGKLVALEILHLQSTGVGGALPTSGPK